MTRQDYQRYAAIYEKHGKGVASRILSVLRRGSGADFNKLIAAAYLLYVYSDKSDSERERTLSCFYDSFEPGTRDLLSSLLDDVIDDVTGLCGSQDFGRDALASVVLCSSASDFFSGGESLTPPSVSRLACALFDTFEVGKETADFCMGRGSFLAEAFLSNPSLSLYGIDIDYALAGIAKIRLAMLGSRAETECADLFTLDGSRRFDRIFSNFPFGIKLNDLKTAGMPLVEALKEKAPGLFRGTSSDWVFAGILSECLAENGKGVAVMTYGDTLNLKDLTARKYFVDNGLIEAVVCLPEKLFDFTAIPTALILFGRMPRDGIMMVNAAPVYESGRRNNYLTEEMISRIVGASLTETDGLSRRITADEIAGNDYVIHPQRYVKKEKPVENGVKFGQIILSATRGAPLRAEELDRMIADPGQDTGCTYLTLSDIQDGAIGGKLTRIREIDESLGKHLVKDRSLIISKSAAPFKIAVARVGEGQKMIASGNLFVIELDESRADPYYVKAFLESPSGAEALARLTVGAVLPVIGIGALKEIMIPLIPIEKQKEFAARYVAKQNEIEELKTILNREIRSKDAMFDGLLF